MKIILAICISLKTLAVFALEETKIQIFTNDSLGIHKERTLYFSPYSPIQNFPKYRDWRFLFEVGGQKKISKYFNSNFGIAFHGYNQSKTTNMPNCFSFYGDFGVANSFYFDKTQKVQFNAAYGFSATRIESTEASSTIGFTQKLAYYGIGLFGKLNIVVYPFKNIGLCVSSRYRIVPAWANSQFSAAGYEFALFGRFSHLQLGLTYRIK